MAQRRILILDETGSAGELAARIERLGYAVEGSVTALSEPGELAGPSSPDVVRLAPVAADLSDRELRLGISRHTGSAVSRGICPSCLQTEFAEELTDAA